MTLDDIAALAALHAKATPGPWYVPADEPCNITNSMEEGACVAGCDFLEGAHDAALIAAAVNALPDLLALARRGLEADARPEPDDVRNAAAFLCRHAADVPPPSTDGTERLLWRLACEYCAGQVQDMNVRVVSRVVLSERGAP